MKLETSRILAQLSEQERNKVEAELSELNGRKHMLEQQHQTSMQRIHQLNQQRDQAMRNRNAASLLQVFDTAFREEQAMVLTVQAAIASMEQQKEAILSRLTTALQTHHAYDGMHQEEKRKQSRSNEIKTERQLDDLVASRKAAASH